MKKLVNLILALFLSLFITNVLAYKAKAKGEFKRASECKKYSKENGNGNFDYRETSGVCYYWKKDVNDGQTDNNPRYQIKLNKKSGPQF